MLDLHGGIEPIQDLEPVADAAEVAKMIDIVRSVHVADTVKAYAVDITAATRRHSDLRLGASPRASLHLIRAARAHAAVEGREYVIPDDLQLLAEPVLAHRLLTSLEAQMAGRDAGSVVRSIVASIAVPAPAGGSRRPA